MFDQEKFNSDLEGGEQFEYEVQAWANRIHGCWYEKMQGNFKDYDLYCSHCHFTIECKSDRIASRTRNFCFELPLLKNSKADYLAYKIWRYDGEVDDPESKYGKRRIYTATEFAYIFDMDALRDWCRRYYVKNPKALVWGGDGKKNQMLLVPAHVVKQLEFKQVVHLQNTKKPVLTKRIPNVLQAKAKV